MKKTPVSELPKNRETVLADLASAATAKKAQIDFKPHLNALAARGQVLEIEELLEAGANVEMPSPNGSLPLVVAAKHGHIEVVKLLLKWGAHSHNAALIAALAANQTSVVEFFQSLITA